MRTRHIWGILAAAVTFVFAAALMVWSMKPPLRPLDYFLSGVVGTFAALIVLFLVVVSTSGISGVFYKRRQKAGVKRQTSTLGI